MVMARRPPSPPGPSHSESKRLPGGVRRHSAPHGSPSCPPTPRPSDDARQHAVALVSAPWSIRLTNRQFSSATVLRSPRENATSHVVGPAPGGNTGGSAGPLLCTGAVFPHRWLRRRASQPPCSCSTADVPAAQTRAGNQLTIEMFAPARGANPLSGEPWDKPHPPLNAFVYPRLAFMSSSAIGEDQMIEQNPHLGETPEPLALSPATLSPSTALALDVIATRRLP